MLDAQTRSNRAIDRDRGGRTLRAAVAVLLLALVEAGCASQTGRVYFSQSDTLDPAASLIVPGTAAWVDTNIDVAAGQPLTIKADGQLFVGKVVSGRYDEPNAVGPEGTFHCNDDVAVQEFPLPAGASGPAPCFCLIGRIDGGDPFYIGRSRSFRPPVAGRLYLGVNDFNLADNAGEFVVQVSQTAAVEPVAYEEFVPIEAASGTHADDCSVVVFYIDGLRPDVVREMAAMGHIPNINRIFIEGGSWMNSAFTAFPSDTITSNGTMWTGCFSDRHGLKGQVSFSRRTMSSESYLEPLGPSRSSRFLAPQGIDRMLHEASAQSVKVMSGDEAAERWRKQQTSGIPPVFEHLRKNGTDWATGVLPMMTEVPPVLWTRSLTKFLPYLSSHEAWKYIDDANADFAKYYLFERESPVTIIWLPETDSVSHKMNRGQFGATRRTIARADKLVGQMVEEIDAKRRLNKTYFILCSDHGHHGGRTTHLAHFDVADEFFHKTRVVTPDGKWAGGGLGLSVRQHRFWNRHPEDKPGEFVFVDGDSDGAARVYLPHGHYRSGVWYAKPQPGDLLAYRVDDRVAPINLIDSLTSISAVHGDGSSQHPIDLVLVKLDDHSVLFATHDRGYAVVSRRRDDEGKWLYKYTPVSHIEPTADGQIAIAEDTALKSDPLGLLQHLHPRMLGYEYTERQWLRMTATSNYPDGVIVLTRHMLWQENLSEQELAHAPDLVVTARPGWFFGIKSSPGTMHGYPFPDAMRASFFVSGPNVRRGARIEEPCRLVDLAPTMLDMIGFDVAKGDFDGIPLRNFYASPAQQQPAPQADIQQTSMAPQPLPTVHAVTWEEIDLKAWNKLMYTPLPDYENLPKTVNRPFEPIDANNIVYNILSLWDVSILRIFDDVLSPLQNGEPKIMHAAEKFDARLRRSTIRAVSRAAEALDITSVAVSDYSATSVGNIKRADGTLDWVQERGNAIDGRIASKMGRNSTPASKGANLAIDGVQWAFWEVYRFTQRVIVQTLDEKLLNEMENTADRALNAFDEQPAQITVPFPEQSPPAPAEVPPSPN